MANKKQAAEQSQFPVFGLLIGVVVIGICIAMAYHTSTNDDFEPPPDANFTITHPSSKGESLAEMLQTQYAKAQERGQKPFVQFTATWCGPCKAISQSLRHPEVSQAFEGVYLVKVDIDEWNSQINESQFHVPYIPIFYECNADGQPTGRKLETSEFTSMSPSGMAPTFKKFFNG